jgi:uncharacterized coiled-coil protein SlyX
MADCAQDRLARLEARAATTEATIKVLYGALRDSAKAHQLAAEAEQLAFRRLLRLERFAVLLYELNPVPMDNGIEEGLCPCPARSAVLELEGLVAEIRRDVAEYERAKGERG